MPGFTNVQVTGRYLDPATGSPRAGTVTFTLAAAMSNAGQSSATSYTGTLDSAGNLTMTVPATNDAGTVPYGQAYRVVENLNGGTAGSSYAQLVGFADVRDGIRLASVPAVGQGAAKVTVTGAKSGNAALASLMTALAGLGLVTDQTTA